MRFNYKWRAAISKLYLDFAEKCNRHEKGTIATLQEIRKLQRRTAEKEYAETRFPNGITVNLSSFLFSEVFLLEDTRNLTAGLQKIFPAISNKITGDSAIDEITRQATDLTSSGWRKVGTIVRKIDKKARFVASSTINFAAIPELPEEVDYIEVELHKFLSSSLVVTFDVHLTELATKHLLSLHNKRNLPSIIFHQLMPWHKFRGWTEIMAYATISNAILESIESSKAKIEDVLSGYFKGVFFNNITVEGHKLPSIEAFNITGSPDKPDEFYNWTRRNHRWWCSLGFYGGSTMFCDEDYAYIWPSYFKENLRTQHRLVVYHTHTGVHQQVFAIQTNSMLQSLILYVTLDQLLRLVEANIIKLRERTLVTSARIKATIQLNKEIQKESAILGRIMMELKQNRPYFESLVYAMSALKPRGTPFAPNFQVGIVNSIEERAKLLNEHVCYLKELNEAYLENLNVDVMYRLQRRSLWAAIIGTVFTIVGTLIAAIEISKKWETIIAWCHEALNFAESVFRML